MALSQPPKRPSAPQRALPVTCDVCIVGSGAGGAPVAYTLARAGFSVIVLEKGPHLERSDFTKDEIAVTRRSIYTPSLKEQQHVMETYAGDGTIERTLGAESGWSFWNGSMVGGSSNLMSGYFHRMKPVDFKLHTTFGPIKDANIVDWPIAYETFEPYYDYVEKVVGVSGRIVPHRNLEPRSSKSFPFPPLAEQPVANWIDAACRTLGYECIPTPRAILPQPLSGREGCSYSNFCGSYGCATGAKGNAKAALLDQTGKTCRIIADAFVYRLEEENGRVVRAHYFDAKGASQSVEATIFVVAAQAVESARLLLNSRSKRFPSGLANTSGHVGKNLIFSAGGVGEGRLYLSKSITPEALFERGTFVNRSLQQWYEYEEGGKRLKGGTIDFLYEHANPIARAMRALYDETGTLRWGRALDGALLDQFTQSRLLTFEVFNDWLPTERTFVSVDDTVTDKWGIPVGKLRLYGHPHDLEVGRFLAQKAQSVLRQMGCRDIASNISSAPPPNLMAGGCRFGNDPATSVLDASCRAHDVENLYVTDGSFMPTGGSVPYTFTIYANAFRVADIILKRLHATLSPLKRSENG